MIESAHTFKGSQQNKNVKAFNKHLMININLIYAKREAGVVKLHLHKE